MGFPIRKSLDQSSFAAPQGLSQRTTSFIASQRQGIHRMLLRHLIALVIDVRSDRQPLQSGSGQATRSQKDQSFRRFQQKNSCLPNITVPDQLSLPQTATFPLHDVDWFCALSRIGALARTNWFIRIFRDLTCSHSPRSTLPPRGAAPKSQKNGGDRRDRTDDLMLAKHALSQLSYVPDPRQSRQASGIPNWWAWDDSNVRPHPYQGCALTT